MNCPECSEAVASESYYCPHCGHRVQPVPGDLAVSQRRKRRAAVSRRKRTTWERSGNPAVRHDSTQEVELWRGKYSAKAMVNYWVVALLATIFIPITVALVGIAAEGWFVVAGVLILPWIGLGGLLFFRKLDERYELTNYQLIHKHGILRRTTDRIEVIDIDDVSYEQGLIEQFINVGTILLTSSDTTHPEIFLDGIDDIRRVANLIDEARRAERIRRGLHIEAI